MNNVSDLADQDNCLGKNSSLCGKIAVLFTACPVFAGTGLNKNNFLHHSTQGWWVFQRPASLAPTECRANCKKCTFFQLRGNSGANWIISLVSSTLLALWFFYILTGNFPIAASFPGFICGLLPVEHQRHFTGEGITWL